MLNKDGIVRVIGGRIILEIDRELYQNRALRDKPGAAACEKAWVNEGAQSRESGSLGQIQYLAGSSE